MKPFSNRPIPFPAVWIFSILLMVFSPVSAGEKQDPESLKKIVLEALKQKVDQKIHNPRIHIQKISRRLRLDKCQTEILVKDRAPEKIVGRMTYQLSCPQPEWKLFVSANVDGDMPVLVAAKGILKQAVIDESDVKQIFVPYKKVKKGALVNVSDAVGMRAKRAIAPNRILTVSILQPPFWVFKGNQVRLITYVGQLKVESKGVALQSGVKQQQIAVRNLSSNKIIKGIVIAPNTLLIP